VQQAGRTAAERAYGELQRSIDVRESARRHALVYLGLDPCDSEDD
jgi:hypothetical protein